MSDYFLDHRITTQDSDKVIHLILSSINCHVNVSAEIAGAPILMNAISHSVKDSLGALFVGEEAHGSGSSPDFPEISLQHVGKYFFKSFLIKASPRFAVSTLGQ